MNVAALILSNLDILWVPVALLVCRPHQRLKAVAFVGLCGLTLRLQTDLIRSTGFDTGFTPIFKGDAHLRGLIVYGVFTALYMLLLYASPRSPWHVLLAASIGIYFLAFVASMFLMAL